jgi:hypothetical protein
VAKRLAKWFRVAPFSIGGERRLEANLRSVDQFSGGGTGSVVGVIGEL